MELLDLHTHHEAPQPEGIIAIRFHGEKPDLWDGQAYSIGVHPWDTHEEITEEEWSLFEDIAGLPQIKAIGECGIDMSGKGGPAFRQLNIFKRQIEIAEKLRKPVVVHDVKAHDMIVGLRRDLKSRMNWAIHGFRGKPQVADMLLRAGCYLSVGIKFSSEALRQIPADRLLAETDEAPVDITEVISLISDVRGSDMRDVVAKNLQTFLT